MSSNSFLYMLDVAALIHTANFHVDVIFSAQNCSDDLTNEEIKIAFPLRVLDTAVFHLIGAKVEIAYGPCITIAGVSHVIVRGIGIHESAPGKPGLVRSTNHVGHRLGSDGDAISVFASSYVWIDHCYLARCLDGLIDVIHASTAITISNNYFQQHDELMYTIGGSANPTILSEGNYFTAPNDPYFKQVTKRDTDAHRKNWKWRSSRDIFQNGAYFVPSGWGTCSPGYTPAQYFGVAPGGLVPALTSDSGPWHQYS
ncbi:Pectate lyase [Dillenia turbinata]|uniref:Pectate lyase n=1 Tax=Dillenia turbinata TaxID=194707 RepID=A0AAN8ZC56_9MAGN